MQTAFIYLTKGATPSTFIRMHRSPEISSRMVQLKTSVRVFFSLFRVRMLVKETLWGRLKKINTHINNRTIINHKWVGRCFNSQIKLSLLQTTLRNALHWTSFNLSQITQPAINCDLIQVITSCHNNSLYFILLWCQQMFCCQAC